MGRYYVQNFGCRATQADGAAIERQLEERGMARAGVLNQADVVVLNTCTVTASADQDARATIRRVHRENPQARIVVTGCYAQRSPDELASLPGVSQVIGNSHKHQLAELVEGFSGNQDQHGGFVPLSKLISPVADVSQRPTTDDGRPFSKRPTTNDQRLIFVSDIFAHTDFLAAPVFDAANERTRPNLKIQDGCDNRCSFCVIPYVRGQSRSMRVEQILEEVNRLVSAGYRELVISGINLGRWGRDLKAEVGPEVSNGTEFGQMPTTDDQRRFSQRPTTNDQGRFLSRLPVLIRAILASTKLEKLRISSVEPMDWTDELITLVAESPRIAKHAHVPMQSGSDAVLRRMHRKYRPWHYRDKIEKIHAAMPTAAIGADVMVGFPGETDGEFDETRRMIEELPFTYLHVFTYSPRPGTPAADMSRQVPTRIARERNRILRDLASQKKRSFMQSFIGKNVEAITLARSSDSSLGTHTPHAESLPGADSAVRDCGTSVLTEALTDNYLPLLLRGELEPNQWLRVRVEEQRDGKLVGTRSSSYFLLLLTQRRREANSDQQTFRR